MNKSLTALIYLVLLLLSTGRVSAVVMVNVVSVESMFQTIEISDIATINLTLSGIGDFGLPSLGIFLTEINYSENILTISSGSISYGTLLDNPFDPSDCNILIIGIRRQDSHDLNNDRVVSRVDKRTWIGLFTNLRGTAYQSIDLKYWKKDEIILLN